MTTNRLTTRLDRLRAQVPAPAMAGYLLIDGDAETPEAARARWYAERPDRVGAELGVIVLTGLQSRPIEPKHSEELAR